MRIISKADRYTGYYELPKTLGKAGLVWLDPDDKMAEQIVPLESFKVKDEAVELNFRLVVPKSQADAMAPMLEENCKRYVSKGLQAGLFRDLIMMESAIQDQIEGHYFVKLRSSRQYERVLEQKIDRLMRYKEAFHRAVALLKKVKL